MDKIVLFQVWQEEVDLTHDRRLTKIEIQKEQQVVLLAKINILLDGKGGNMVAIRVIWSGRSVWYTYHEINSWLRRVSRIKLLIGVCLLPELVEHVAFYCKCRTGWLGTWNSVEGHYAMLWEHCTPIRIERSYRSYKLCQVWSPSNPQKHKSNEENHTSYNQASLSENRYLFLPLLLIQRFVLI